MSEAMRERQHAIMLAHRWLDRIDDPDSDTCVMARQFLRALETFPPTPDRRMLPERRASETFEVIYGEQRTPFSVTVGCYDDGTVGEVFITGAKAGSDMDAAARDGAILLSLALQHRVPLRVLQHAVTRNQDGTASTIVGVVIDRIARHEE
jgi:hypothetical protein